MTSTKLATCFTITYNKLTAVFALTTPTNFLGYSDYRRDVLDVTLVKLPHHYTNIQNLNDLSSDHNPVLLTISDSSIFSSLPTAARRINWLKFTTKLNKLITEKLSFIDIADQLEDVLRSFTINTQTAITASTFLLPTTRRINNIPVEILHEIQLKNRLRRE